MAAIAAECNTLSLVYGHASAAVFTGTYELTKDSRQVPLTQSETWTFMALLKPAALGAEKSARQPGRVN
jgi:hypothetical protein